MTAFFDGDDDELLKSLQRQSKVHCIKQLLFVCRQFQDRAELFVGVQAQDHWNGDKVETSDFDEVIEVIASAFRHQANLRQFSIFDSKNPTDNEIQNEWLHWFDKYLERLIDSTEVVRLVLYLAKHSSDFVKFKDRIKANPKIAEISSEITTYIRENHFPSANLRAAPMLNASKKEAKARLEDWEECECTKGGEPPCKTEPCITMAKRSAEKGIPLW